MLAVRARGLGVLRGVLDSALVLGFLDLVELLEGGRPDPGSVAGLFGPTEWWRNGSPRPEDICIERDDIGCRTDCHRRSCSEWVCMDIEVERVLGAVSERLRRARSAGILETTVGA